MFGDVHGGGGDVSCASAYGRGFMAIEAFEGEILAISPFAYCVLMTLTRVQAELHTSSWSYLSGHCPDQNLRLRIATTSCSVR